MQLRTLLAISVCSLVAAGPLSAQLPPRAPTAPAPQPAPPPKPLKDEDTAKLLAQLEEMTKKLDEYNFGYNSKLIRELREAGTSGDKSFNLWMDCMKDVEFDQKGKSASEFADWKRRQTKDADRERDAALQLQVQWLAIVLMHANARTDAAKGEAITAATAFLDTVVDRIQKADGRLDNHANENVLGSVFARHFKLDSTVERVENAAYVPGDVDSIYDQMILPYYRATKSGYLMQAWNKRIEQQQAIAAAFKFIEAKEKFTSEKLPNLRWGQARDLFQLGQEETAAQQMMTILKANVHHKHASRWMDEMTALLKKEELPEQPKTSPNTPPAPVPAPSSDAPRGPGKGPFPGGKPR